MIKKIFPKNINLLKVPTLKNKTVIVSGGATGLGEMMANHFASNGAKTIICSRNEDNLRNTTKLINDSNSNTNVDWIPVDVSNPKSVDEFYKELKNRNYNPDILINNAAGNFICKSEDLSPNAINRVIDIVLKGTINMTIPFSKNIISQEKFGSVLSISTLYASTGSGFVLPSAIAKGGVEIMSKSLASEWGKHGIRFNCIAPGSIYTEGAFSRLDPTGKFKKSLEDKNPCGRLGEREELANLVTYISSDYCNWLNGQIINFDGGEGGFRAGQFNELNYLPDEFWQMIKK